MSKIDTLSTIDSSGNEEELYPKTKAKAVVCDDGSTAEKKLSDLARNLTTVTSTANSAKTTADTDHAYVETLKTTIDSASTDNEKIAKNAADISVLSQDVGDAIVHEIDVTASTSKNYQVGSGLSIGNYIFTLDANGTGNAGECEIGVIYSGETGWTTLTKINFGTSVTVSLTKEITNIRIYIGSSRLTASGTVIWSMQNYDGIQYRLDGNIVKTTSMVSKVDAIEDDSISLSESVDGLEAKEVAIADTDWVDGYWKNDLSFSTSSAWKRVKITLDNNKVTLKYTLTNSAPTSVYSLVTDKNDNILNSSIAPAGTDKTVDISTIEGAKYIYLSAYGSATYSASLSYKEVRGLNTRVTTLEGLIDASTTPLNQKKVLVIGDSISTGASSVATDSNFPSYGSYNKWVDVLMDEKFFPSDLVNCSIHATGFVAQLSTISLSYNGTSYTNDFLNRVKYLEAKGMDLSTFDLIVVYGGINDMKKMNHNDSLCELGTKGDGDTTKFYGALQAFYDYIFTKGMQARICAIMPMKTSHDWVNWDGQNTLGLKPSDYLNAMKDVLGDYCIPYLDLTTQSGFLPQNTAFKAMWTRDYDGTGKGDGLHPTYDYCVKYLAPQIKGFINGLI